MNGNDGVLLGPGNWGVWQDLGQGVEVCTLGGDAPDTVRVRGPITGRDQLIRFSWDHLISHLGSWITTTGPIDVMALPGFGLAQLRVKLADRNGER